MFISPVLAIFSVSRLAIYVSKPTIYVSNPEIHVSRLTITFFDAKVQKSFERQKILLGNVIDDNMNGQRVEKVRFGIYIKSNKKILVK